MEISLRQMIVSALASCALVACATTDPAAVAVAPASTQSSVPGQLTTQADLSPIIGKSLVFGPGQAIAISDDGTIRGSWDGKPVAGSYIMRDGFFCRTLTAGPRGPSAEDCQLWIRDGSKISVSRNRGTANEIIYTVAGL